MSRFFISSRGLEIMILLSVLYCMISFNKRECVEKEQYYIHSNSSCQYKNVYGTLELRCYPLLINYAADCCKLAQTENCRTGLKHGMRQCVPLNKSVLINDLHFMRRNIDILNRTRGAGYWLWKPYIIYKELYHARDGDIIMYSDAAAKIIARVSYLFKLFKIQDIIVFQHVDLKVRKENFSIRWNIQHWEFVYLMRYSKPRWIRLCLRKSTKKRYWRNRSRFPSWEVVANLKLLPVLTKWLFGDIWFLLSEPVFYSPL